ncbi:MAG: DUF6056 family protein [Actinomycetota bacterium]
MRSGRGLLAIGLLGGVLVAAIAPLLFLGHYVRPTSDDWCLLPLARSGGFNAVVSDVYELQNGRLGNAAALGVIFTTYELSSRILPGIVLVLLLLTFFGIWRALFLHAFGTGGRVATVCGAALAAGTVLALLLGKPHRYQTLYHAPTVVSHTMPLMIAGVILLAVLALHHRRRIWPGAAAALLGGAVLGTFNEAFTGVALVTVVAGLALWWLLPRHAIHWVVVVSGGVGLLLGFASVFTSPGSRNRQQLIHGGSLFSTHLIHQTLTAWFRVVSTAFTSGEGVVLLLVSAAVGVWLGAGIRRIGRGHSMRFYVAALVVPALWAVTASFGATFVLVYSFNGKLVGRERAWPSITVSLLLAASWYAVLLGQLAARKVASAESISGRRLVAVAGAVVSASALVLLVLGGLDLIRDEHDLATVMKARSVAWDRQQIVIHREIAAGAKSIVLTPLPIDGLYEPFYPNVSSAWPASCAPDFYGVDQVVHPPLARK